MSVKQSWVMKPNSPNYRIHYHADQFPEESITVQWYNDYYIASLHTNFVDIANSYMLIHGRRYCIGDGSSNVYCPSPPLGKTDIVIINVVGDLISVNEGPFIRAPGIDRGSSVKITYTPGAIKDIRYFDLFPHNVEQLMTTIRIIDTPETTTAATPDQTPGPISGPASNSEPNPGHTFSRDQTWGSVTDPTPEPEPEPEPEPKKQEPGAEPVQLGWNWPTFVIILVAAILLIGVILGLAHRMVHSGYRRYGPSLI